MNHDRYIRQTVLVDFGPRGQQRLRESKVLVVGAGGLGVPVMQYLTSMGVGSLTLIDGDEVSLSNLQRQVLYREDDIGKKKVEIAADRLQQMNSEAKIQPIPEMFSSENAKELVEEHDLVVDCTDNIQARYALNDACIEADKPFVYGALYKHEGHVSVFNFNGSVSYRDVYPDDTVQVDNCNDIGVLGVLPGIIGTYQALEAVKILTGFGESLVGKLLIVDAASSDHSVIELAKSKEQITKVEPVEHWITWQDLNDMDISRFQLLDIRQPTDYEHFHDKRFENLPMHAFDSFDPEKGDVILVCNHGISTRSVSAYLIQNFDLKVLQIEGGYSSRA